MCLGIPMKITAIAGDFAQVEAGKLKRKINIQMLVSLKAGDYVLIHAGFAIQKINPEAAADTLKLIDALY